MILLTAVSMIYEFGLIVPAIDLQFRFLYCGDSQFNYQVGIVGNGAELTHGSNTIFGVNTQHLICLFSTAFMWFISIVAVLIDNGVCVKLRISVFFCLDRYLRVFFSSYDFLRGIHACYPAADESQQHRFFILELTTLFPVLLPFI